MTWVRNDDQAPLHRKIAPLSDSAFRLHEEAKCWASRNGTDGRIAADEIATISVSPTVQRGLARFVAECVRRGIWHRAEDPRCQSERCVTPGPDGWVLHDYLDYNPSAAQVADDRKAKRDRMAAWREKKHGRSTTTSAPQDAPPTAPQEVSPDPPQAVSRDGPVTGLVPSPPTPPRPAPKEGGGGAPAASAARHGAAERAADGWEEDHKPAASRPPPSNGEPTTAAKAAIRAVVAAHSRFADEQARTDALDVLRELTPEIPMFVEPVPPEGGYPIPEEA